jgi:hypothetical protein
VLPAAASDMTLRLDLKAVKAGDAVPVAVTITADGAAPATATVDLTASATPAGLAYFTVDHGGLAMAANTVVTCLPTDGRCDENNNHQRSRLRRRRLDARRHRLVAGRPRPARRRHHPERHPEVGRQPGRRPDDSPAALGAVTFLVPGGAPTVIHSTGPLQMPDEAYSASADVLH